ncbi:MULTISPECIES: FxDxF family PEP-CTERM protein [unclassified Duganella]|jgi:hypothetical protein|uniref:FxDxF family PEP-CTERM protein n=1 Tax=unclassified Duganella TaxID=2636909 RepID=UPI0008815FDD|nr:MULTISPECIES: FxDxF family PEP-CTERM protein [unclassified Duganella]SDF69156.1 PEP-CTERM protein-sorting domain-containing protein [Duganella sp. OV458]SDI60158.1 PEP-CTERM protein-sorting domain-containing protein [Duganella sp. OV510]
MNTILRHAACAVALLAATAAQATTYQYSYTFADGNVASGTFDGTANGNLITDLTNITAFANGVAFKTQYGEVATTIFNYASDMWGGAAGGAVASFDGTANNLLFTGGTRQPGGGFFYGSTLNLGPRMTNLLGAGVTPWGSTGGAYSAARWSVSAVPEPATYGMLLGGLGLVGLMARRRRAA